MLSYRDVNKNEMFDAAMIRRISLFRALPYLPDLHTPQEDETYWREELSLSQHIIGAYDDTALIAVIAYGNGWVNQLYVHPDFQGRGIGSRLLAHAFADAEKLELWTFQANRPARNFYEKHGFTAIEETDGSGNEEREPDIRYGWKKPQNR